MMENREMIEGVCCQYCSKAELNGCPIVTASPWSRWDYCNNFRDDRGKTIPEMLKEQIDRNSEKGK